MDRYQFEDLISQYLDNSLTLSERKAFENYLKQHPESREQVDSMRAMLDRMKKLNRIKTSADFTANLKTKLAHANIEIARHEESKKRYFGLTPLYATALVAMVAGFIITGVQFFPGNATPGVLPGSSRPMANEAIIPTPNPTPQPVSEPALADAENDSVFDQAVPRSENIDLGNKVQFVKDSPR